MPPSILIIGAGLAGLTAAVRLNDRRYSVTVLEARDRIGGRTLSVTADDGAGPFDLGGAWFWSNHPHVRKLAEELGISTFLEFETGDRVLDAGDGIPIVTTEAPGNQDYTYRFAGGAQLLCERLAERLPDGAILCKTIVQSIDQKEQGLSVAAVQKNGTPVTYEADHVIVTLPPQLARHSIRYTPPLPEALAAVMEGTQTWMGRAMKVVVAYNRAFWRDRGQSGIGVSFEGPVYRFHDASTADQTHPALFGWIEEDHPIRTLQPVARRTAVLMQLARMFGPEAGRPKFYMEMDWSYDPYTSVPKDANMPSGKTLYGHPLFQQPVLNGRLHWAGAETSPIHGGYLDGAVWSGERKAREIDGLTD